MMLGLLLGHTDRGWKNERTNSSLNSSSVTEWASAENYMQAVKRG